MPLRNDLLTPIPGENPSGPDLRYNSKVPIYDQVKEARRQDDDLAQGDWQHERKVADYAKSKGVDVTLRFVTEEETGADHCQHDNPTIGQELMVDWLADKFGIDERELRKKAMNPLI